MSGGPEAVKVTVAMPKLTRSIQEGGIHVRHQAVTQIGVRTPDRLRRIVKAPVLLARSGTAVGSAAIDSIALRIAHPLDNSRPFQVRRRALLS